jgi:ATP sulfurylase
MTETIAPHGGTLVNLLSSRAEAEQLARQAARHPKIKVNERELSDLEMLTVGALSPLTGFVGEKDYHAILETMHLTNGLPWTIPVTLSLSPEEAKRIGRADTVTLASAQGARPLAVVEVDGVFRRDRGKEAQAVFGTEDLEPATTACQEPCAPCASQSTTPSPSTGSHPPRRVPSSQGADGRPSSGSRRAIRSTGLTSTSRSAHSRSWTACSYIRS